VRGAGQSRSSPDVWGEGARPGISGVVLGTPQWRTPAFSKMHDDADVRQPWQSGFQENGLLAGASLNWYRDSV